MFQWYKSVISELTVFRRLTAKLSSQCDKRTCLHYHIGPQEQRLLGNGSWVLFAPEKLQVNYISLVFISGT